MYKVSELPGSARDQLSFHLAADGTEQLSEGLPRLWDI